MNEAGGADRRRRSEIWKIRLIPLEKFTFFYTFKDFFPYKLAVMGWDSMSAFRKVERKSNENPKIFEIEKRKTKGKKPRKTKNESRKTKFRRSSGQQQPNQPNTVPDYPQFVHIKRPLDSQKTLFHLFSSQFSLIWRFWHFHISKWLRNRPILKQKIRLFEWWIIRKWEEMGMNKWICIWNG
jgi:hypothetical protein